MNTNTNTNANTNTNTNPNVSSGSALKYFEEISAIPRGSRNEKAIADYLVAFAEKRGLSWYRDEIDNVVIRKGGSAGAEALPPVMLQGHTDMVCEKNADTRHDFAREGIRLVREGGFLRADGTTLGADNGVAVAYMLAALADNTLAHPPLECVFTVQEETGLIGAAELDCTGLKARTLINLDGGPFGTAVVSCAGGLRAYFRRKIEPQPRTGVYPLDISVRGLAGGHSGLDIRHGRGNANKLMGRLLAAVLDQYGAELAALAGGLKDNAIPRESDATLLFGSSKAQSAAASLLKTLADEIKAEYTETDPDFHVVLTERGKCDAVSFGRGLTGDVVRLIVLAQDGALKSSARSGGFVVASNNLGVIERDGDFLCLSFAPRSSVASLQEQTKRTLLLLGQTFGFDVEFGSEYPGWSFAPVSPIRDAFLRSYQSQFGGELKVEAIHAGLECGLFSDKLPGLDAISLGPTVVGYHTPKETLDLDSFEKMWLLLTDVLAQAAEDRL